MKQLNPLDWLALILVIIGGINWGIIGISGIDLVESFSGEMWYIPRIIYVLVGLSAVYLLRISLKLRKKDKARLKD